MGFGPAFGAALNAYFSSNIEPAVVAEICKITDSNDTPPPVSPPFPEHRNMSTWFPQPAWLKKREEKKRKEREEMEEKEKKEREEKEKREREKREKEREESEQQALIDIIKTYCLRKSLRSKSQRLRSQMLCRVP
jgi:hypothetical protein